MDNVYYWGLSSDGGNDHPQWHGHCLDDFEIDKLKKKKKKKDLKIMFFDFECHWFDHCRSYNRDIRDLDLHNYYRRPMDHVHYWGLSSNDSYFSFNIKVDYSIISFYKKMMLIVGLVQN